MDCLFVFLMVFNATFNNIAVISWQSVLLIAETEGPGENHRPVASHWQNLSYIVVHLALIEIGNIQHKTQNKYKQSKNTTKKHERVSNKDQNKDWA